MMSEIERILGKFDSDSSDEEKKGEILNCQFPFVRFFQLIVFVSQNSENKRLFVTQFIFYLMVLFVPAANKKNVTHWKTLRVSFTYFVDFCTIVPLVGVMWKISSWFVSYAPGENKPIRTRE